VKGGGDLAVGMLRDWEPLLLIIIVFYLYGFIRIFIPTVILKNQGNLSRFIN
jgi:hypothetical protein